MPFKSEPTDYKPAHFAPGNDTPKPRRKHNVPLIIAIVIVALAAVAYAAGTIVFSNIYYPGTVIAGTDVSLCTASGAAERLRAASPAYSFELTGEDFAWSYAPETIDDLIDVEAVTQGELAKNEVFIWPVRLISALLSPESEQDAIDTATAPDFSRFSSSFDEAAFEEELGAAVDTHNEDRSGTFTPTGAYDPEAGAFTPEHARACKKFDRDEVIAFAKAHLAALSPTASLDELGEEAYLPLEGDVSDEQIESACDAMNELAGTDLSLKMGGAEVARVDGALIAQWIVLDENCAPSIDEEAVAAWVEKLADSLDTVGTERTYTRPDGKEITVSGGTFGWKVDREALAELVSSALADKQTGEADVPCSQTGDVFTAPGERDWGAYVDIDISEQYARYYDADGNILWESGVITGNPNLGQDTPTGVYYLNNSLRNITLVGRTDPETGEPEYETPVSFWMAFVGSAVGLHDATWQASSSFGDPNAYYYCGSHGCVNLPYNKAEELFGMLEVGTCVITHQ